MPLVKISLAFSASNQTLASIYYMIYHYDILSLSPTQSKSYKSIRCIQQTTLNAPPKQGFPKIIIIQNNSSLLNFEWWRKVVRQIIMQNFSVIHKAVPLLWRCKVKYFIKLSATIRAPIAFFGLFSCISNRKIAWLLYTIVLCHKEHEFDYVRFTRFRI